VSVLIHAEFLNVPCMRECNRLVRAFVVAEYAERFAQPRGDNEHEDANNNGDKKEANEAQNAPFN